MAKKQDHIFVCLDEDNNAGIGNTVGEAYTDYNDCHDGSYPLDSLKFYRCVEIEIEIKEKVSLVPSEV